MITGKKEFSEQEILAYVLDNFLSFWENDGTYESAELVLGSEEKPESVEIWEPFENHEWMQLVEWMNDMIFSLSEFVAGDY